MATDPFTKALWDARRSVLGWAVAIGGVTVLYAAFYPQISTPSFAEAMKSYPEGLKRAFNIQDITTASGYLGSYVFGLLTPVLLAIFMVIMGSRAVAGDEEAGFLDLPLAHPVGRLRLALSRLAALCVIVLGVCAVVCLALLAIAKPAKIDSVGAGHLLAASTHLAAFGIFFGALAVAVGAATGRRGAAVGVGTAIAVLGYFANNLATQVPALSWAQRLSPFYWYARGTPLVHGFRSGDVLLLLGTAAVFTTLGLLRFCHRDLAT